MTKPEDDTANEVEADDRGIGRTRDCEGAEEARLAQANCSAPGRG